LKWSLLVHGFILTAAVKAKAASPARKLIKTRIKFAEEIIFEIFEQEEGESQFTFSFPQIKFKS
jgi:hypothetical protein